MEIRLKGQAEMEAALLAMYSHQLFDVLGKKFRVVEIVETMTVDQDLVRGVARLNPEITKEQLARYAEIAGAGTLGNVVDIEA